MVNLIRKTSRMIYPLIFIDVIPCVNPFGVPLVEHDLGVIESLLPLIRIVGLVLEFYSKRGGANGLL